MQSSVHFYPENATYTSKTDGINVVRVNHESKTVLAVILPQCLSPFESDNFVRTVGKTICTSSVDVYFFGRETVTRRISASFMKVVGYIPKTV